MRRREFITLLGGTAAAWPLAVRAQQSLTPVIGYLSGTVPRVAGGPEDLAFRRGLRELGYVEGQNLKIEVRAAGDDYARLPELAAELARMRVAAIVATGGARGPLAAKAATSTIPIVFYFGSDPVEIGLVNSLSRPGGNITGVSALGRELLAKRVEMLRELLPSITAIGLLANPDNPNTPSSVRELEGWAQAGSWQLPVAPVRIGTDIDTAVAKLAELRAGALLAATDNVINSRTGRLIDLAAQYKLPAIYQGAEAVAAGGLMSYGSDGVEMWRVVGAYVGRILKGEKPSDLPVQRATKVELRINLKTAKALGLTFPTAILVRADEVLE